ncbi:hypothetical protein [Streptomyces sp. NPDC001135]
MSKAVGRHFSPVPAMCVRAPPDARSGGVSPSTANPATTGRGWASTPAQTDATVSGERRKGTRARLDTEHRARGARHGRKAGAVAVSEAGVRLTFFFHPDMAQRPYTGSYLPLRGPMTSEA